MKDNNNATYTLEVEEIHSPLGDIYHTEKYQPKIDAINSCLQLKELKLLDVGIGYGAFLKLAEKQKGWTTFGMDPFDQSIEITKKFTSADIRKGKIEDKEWPFEENYFDVITCFDVIEHLENPELFFKHIKKYIKPNGIIVASTPLKLIPYSLRKVPLIGFPDLNPTHINVQPPSFWEHLIDSNGFLTLATWRGEHLTHIKILPGVIRRINAFWKFDHRKTPFLNQFEQAFNFVIKVAS